MKKKESDSQSTTSTNSRSSDRTNRKTPRFSIRRIFPRRHSTKSIKSHTSADQESKSDGNPSQSERDVTLQSIASEEALHTSDKNALECPLCLSQHPEEAFPSISTCHHRSCSSCLQQYLKIEITESRVNITCPECAERFHPNDIKSILNDVNLMNKYEEFMLRRVLVGDPDTRWCPAPDCGYAVIASGCASCPKLKCERPGCDTSFCYHCKQYWHPNQTCDTARAERAANQRSSSLTYSNDSGSHSEIKPCPRCGAFIIKMDDGSCNHMTCAVCGAEFCWLCMKEISDLHYLSPSGCTFWGKKPWSRKKKILWQLGTLVGAPVGIGLVAGIAVPAMIIGIPVWVGRKLYGKYEHAPKHKRNLVMVGGVTASILISPVLAGLAVGVGVPILLAYVYGVVPISLCRSGGCGLTTTDSGGVRFEFEEDNEVTVGQSSQFARDAQSVETTSHHVANPSIGPSIGEVSMAMTCNSLSASGSHMDRVGVIRDESDRESASHRAIAGSSLNGSLSGSAVAGPSGFQHRLEVQADVSAHPQQNKRSSFSSESANFSLGDAKSATVSFSDDASTKALAGSLAGAREKDVTMSIPPLEVHVDVSSSSARYRHSSGDSRHSQHKPAHTSPLSSRSVNFLSEDVRRHSKSKCYKRQSVSVGDKIHEHADASTLDRLSMRSYTPETDLTMESPEKPESPLEGATSPLYTNDSLNSSSSFDSTSSQQPLCSNKRSHCGGITQVESDKPFTSLAVEVLRQHRKSVENYLTKNESAKDTFDNEMFDASNTSLMLPESLHQDKHVQVEGQSMRSHRANSNGSQSKDCEPRSHRRSSCQMAMQDGCLTMEDM